MPSHDPGRPPAVWLLLGLLGFLGVRALLGGGQFILVPSGDLLGVSQSMLAGTPFDDFLIPGIVLFGVLGVLPLSVLLGVYRGRRWAWWGSVVVAITLVGWVLVEGVLIGFGERLQYLNLVQAIVMLALALSPTVREHLDQ